MSRRGANCSSVPVTATSARASTNSSRASRSLLKILLERCSLGNPRIRRLWVLRPGRGPGGLCECPGAFARAGEAEVDEPAEVEGGGPVAEPGVVLGDAAVGDAAVSAGDQTGDGPLDWRGGPG